MRRIGIALVVSAVALQPLTRLRVASTQLRGGAGPLDDGVAKAKQLVAAGQLDDAERLLLELRALDARRADLPPQLREAFALVFEARAAADASDPGPFDALARRPRGEKGRGDAGRRRSTAARVDSGRRVAATLRPRRGKAEETDRGAAAAAERPRTASRGDAAAATRKVGGDGSRTPRPRRGKAEEAHRGAAAAAERPLTTGYGGTSQAALAADAEDWEAVAAACERGVERGGATPSRRALALRARRSTWRGFETPDGGPPGWEPNGAVP